MEYWRGEMNWEIKKDWVCETCGMNAGLTWGLAHGECRCNLCHTPYFMRDEDGKIVDVPISLIKPEYKEAAKLAWEELHKPIDMLTDNEWDEFLYRSENKQEVISHD